MMPNDPETAYNRSPARIRSLLSILQAYWERHPDMSLTEILDFLSECADKQPQEMYDSDWSCIITKEMNDELKAELLGAPRTMQDLIAEQDVHPIPDVSILGGAIPDEDLDEFVGKKGAA